MIRKMFGAGFLAIACLIGLIAYVMRLNLRATEMIVPTVVVGAIFLSALYLAWFSGYKAPDSIAWAFITSGLLYMSFHIVPSFFKEALPGTAEGMSRRAAVFDHNNAIKAAADTVQINNEGPCEIFVGKFVANDRLNPGKRIVVVGYTIRPDGSIACYPLDDLSNPGFDGNGVEIKPVNTVIMARIHAQVKAEAEKEQARIKAVQQEESARRTAAALAEQEHARQTTQPVATVEPTDIPKPSAHQNCLENNEIRVSLKKPIELDKFRDQVSTKLNQSITLESGTVIAPMGTEVKISVSAANVDARYPQSASVDMEILSIKGTDIRGRVLPVRVGAIQQEQYNTLRSWGGQPVISMPTGQYRYRYFLDGTQTLRLAQDVCPTTTASR